MLEYIHGATQLTYDMNQACYFQWAHTISCICPIQELFKF